jgi:hypothetical protein
MQAPAPGLPLVGGALRNVYFVGDLYLAQRFVQALDGLIEPLFGCAGAQPKKPYLPIQAKVSRWVSPTWSAWNPPIDKPAIALCSRSASVW